MTNVLLFGTPHSMQTKMNSTSPLLPSGMTMRIPALLIPNDIKYFVNTCYNLNRVVAGVTFPASVTVSRTR